MRPVFLAAAISILLGCPGGGPSDGGTGGGSGGGSAGGSTGGGTGGSTGGGTSGGTGGSTGGGTGGSTGGGSGGGPDAGSDAGVVDAGPPHELTGIVVTPRNTLLEVDVNTVGTQVFVATGTYRDGVPEDLSSQATWTVVNANVGTMSGATLSTRSFPAVAVETSIVRAAVGAINGEAQLTVVAYRRSGTLQDTLWVLPYLAPDAGARTLDFATAVPPEDVFFLMDTTGSMIGSISNLQSSIASTVIPAVRSVAPDSQFGVGAFEDFPILPYGSLHGSDCGMGGLATPDQPFHLFQSITSDIAMVQTGVGRLRTATGPIGCGQDWPEAGFEALYQAATGNGLSAPSPTNVPANHVGIGGVVFRQGALPVIVTITDAMPHGPGETATCPTTGESANYTGTVATVARSRAQSKSALQAICARVVGIAPIQPSLAAQCSGQAWLEDFATTTGARVPPSAWDVGTRPVGCAATQCCTAENGAGRAPDATGLCPLVFRITPNGAGLGPSVVTALQSLTRFAPFDVTSTQVGAATDLDGGTLPAGMTGADFIKSVAPTGFVKPAPPPVLADPTFDATSFHGVVSGTTLTYAVTASNDFVMPGAAGRLVLVTVRIFLDGCLELGRRDVLVLVPPVPL